MKNNGPLLTISLLISNRPDTVPRCLDSLHKIREAIPSELILIDTSKSDEMHELLLTYTDQVYKFEWCHDFAKARNEGIERAKGRWFLYLDDDEWFDNVDMLVAFFETGEYENFTAVNMQIRNFTNVKYTQYTDSWVTRLFSLENGAHFEGKVHEYICNLKGEQLFLPEMIYHSGYAFESEEKKRLHYERNATLLLDLVEKEPTVLRWQGQMVQEYYVVEDWKAIVEFCPDRLKKEIPINNFMDRNYICTLYAGLIDACLHLELFQEFKKWCERALNDNRSTDVLKAYVNLRKAENSIDNDDDLECAQEFVKNYLDYHKQYQENELAMREQIGALLVNRTFQKGYLDTAKNILLYVALKRGKLEALEECLILLTSEEGFSLGCKLINYLVELFASTEERELYYRIVDAAIEDSSHCNMFCAEAQRWEEKDRIAFLKVAHIYAQTKGIFWFIHYCRLVDADFIGTREDVENTLIPMVKAMPNIFLLPDSAYAIIQKHNLPIVKIWMEIVGDQWNYLTKQFVDNCEESAIKQVKNLLYAELEDDDWHMISWKVSIVEKKLVTGPGEKIDEYYKLLKIYAPLKLELYRQCKESMSERVPMDVLAAIKINEYIEEGKKDEIHALIKLKEAVAECPLFANAFQAYIHRHSELEAARQIEQKDEMSLLRTKVILQVRGMMEACQMDAALQILQQLLGLFPGDEEIEQLIYEMEKNDN